MISSQSIPAAFPTGVLRIETLMRVNKCQQINNLGFSILDQWMLSDPEMLREVEKNPMFLLMIIMDQQTKAEKILDTPIARQQMAQGLTPHEILTLNGVETKLSTAIAESGAIM